MSFELTYQIGEEPVVSRVVYPKGRFSIVTTRQNHRYKEELTGEMVFMGDDFDWIMDAGPCTEIKITCEFKRTWSGLFSHTDCSSINRSKKKLEVVPRTNDEYDKIEPWMRLEMNIIPPYKGIDSRVPVFTYNQYEIEEKRVRIEEPYADYIADGKEWNGYSVNDWVRGDSLSWIENNYTALSSRRNSLIWKLCSNIKLEWIGNDFSTGGPYRSDRFYWQNHDAFPNPGSTYEYGGWPTTNASDQDNLLLWLDYGGYERYLAEGSLPSVLSFFRRSGGLFTLTEVINYFDDNGVWEYCDLIYTREVFRSPQMPPSGNISDNYDLQQRVRGWAYIEDEKLWARRPINMMSENFVNPWPPFSVDHVVELHRSGDGSWFSELLDGIIDGKNVKRQTLVLNRRYEEAHGHTWYEILYGTTVFKKIFHKPETIVKKFIEFVKDEGATTNLSADDFESRYFTEETCPYDGFPSLWKDFLLAQNSDVKRPLATEKATKEMMSFQDFLEIICRLTNSEWAIIDGKFIIEHISYFDRGLTYDPFAKSSEVQILNPYSIENVAKNKGFMQLTDIYHYDRPNMPKFEIYQTAGGEEPKNNNTRIEYSGGCINNKPNENIDEIVIDTTTDYNFTKSEGGDDGITLISTDTFLYSGGIGTFLVNRFVPHLDEYGRYIYNRDFTLEKIIERCHNWGRNDTQATLNKKEWLPLQPFKYVIQPVSFPYKVASPEKMENPYTLVVTGLGYGIINRAEYITKTSWVNYELGLWPIANIIPPDEKIDWHVHDQIVESDTWLIKHDMITNFMMRPVIFDTDGNEIDYNSFRILNVHEVEIKFTSAVNGQAHLISLDLPTEKRHIAGFFGSSNTLITHNLNQGVDGLALSPVFDFMGNEIEPDSIEYVSNNAIRVKFTSAISGYMAIGDITGGYVSVYSETPAIATDSVDMIRTANRVYGKPIVLMAGEEILYNSQQLLTSLRRIGFSEEIIATIVVMEKTKD